MGGIGGMFGLAGGASGSGYAAPNQGVGVTSGTNTAQIGTAYDANQSALQSQQALLAALQSQNGLGNQSQVYNQLQGVANGTGPNPAQAQLAQATGQNTANQAALMAGQRGASSNVGLMARQAAQQGAANQQNSAGQAATLQANQSLNALGQAGNMANTQASQQIGATTANTQANQSEQQILQNALSQQNNANVSMQSNINNANAGLANTSAQGQQQIVGGAMNGAGAALMAAHGGVIGSYADGGMSSTQVSGPASSVGKYMQGWAGNQAAGPNQVNTMAQPASQSSQPLQQGSSNLTSGLLSGLKNPPMNPMQTTTLQSGQAAALGGSSGSGPTGAGNLASDFVMSAQGGNIGSKLKSGGGVPGKALVKGNSYANDTVNAKLSPGEGVIDRETMQDKGPLGHMARSLMDAINSKKGKK